MNEQSGGTGVVVQPADEEAQPLSPRLRHAVQSSPQQPPPPSTPALGVTYEFPTSRPFRDIVWLGLFLLHLAFVGWALVHLGNERWEFKGGGCCSTEEIWPMYGAASIIGAGLAVLWLVIYTRRTDTIIKFSVHSVSTYGAVGSVFLFWNGSYFWGIVFACGAIFVFFYTLSVLDRLPFTVLMLQKAVKLVALHYSVHEAVFIALFLGLGWIALWAYGAAGTVATSDDADQWWKLGLQAASLFWTGAVLGNMVHVATSGTMALWLFQGDQRMPKHSTRKAVARALTTSAGSICLGSLFNAVIRTLRWATRSVRGKCEGNECMLCCVDSVFFVVEGLVRVFNKYAYVQVALFGKGFNRAATDTWERFQLTGVDRLVAYDLSGAVLLLSVVLGGLITGTIIGTWVHYVHPDRAAMVALTAMLLAMLLIGMGVVVVEAAVTSLYVAYSEDPNLISRFDPELATAMDGMLNERLARRHPPKR